MRERTPADDIVQGAYNRALLDLILPAMRLSAKEAGYALTIHGSLNRDIDLVAVPWSELNVWTADALLESLCGAVRGVTGRCSLHGDWTAKPHGRRAKGLIAWCGESTAHLDISFMPAVEPADDD